MQTYIAILENTKSRLFLKARTNSDIIKDLILVALNIESEYKFDLKKNIVENFIKIHKKKSYDQLRA